MCERVRERGQMRVPSHSQMSNHHQSIIPYIYILSTRGKSTTLSAYGQLPGHEVPHQIDALVGAQPLVQKSRQGLSLGRAGSGCVCG